MRYLIIILTLFMPFWAQAQFNFGGAKQDEAVLWKLDKQAVGDSITLKVTAHIKPDFHIWALDAGGDGSLISTSLTINDTENVKWMSVEKPIEVNLDFIEGALFWHETKATFVATVHKNVVNDADFKVNVTYQVCNYTMCYPPKDVDLK